MTEAGAAVPSHARVRSHRRDLALEVTRSGCAVVAAAGLVGVPGAAGAVPAHLALLVVSLVVVVRLARGLPCPRRTSLLLTGGTLAFWVGHSLAYSDVPGPGSTLGVLALVEAAVRYGVRGALVSGPVVTATALLLPQVSPSGSTQGPGTVLLLVALLLGAAVWLRHGSEQAAAHAERTDAAVADALASLPVGVAVLDADGTVLHANARYDLLLAGEPPDLAPLLGGAGRTELERAGRSLAVGVARTAHGRLVVHVEDVTAARDERDRLDHLASVDRLTGLTSRSAGEDALHRRSSRGGPYAVLFVDLDGVKRLNDLRGHSAGDLVLTEAAFRLRAVLRDDDTAVRWGGDEFVVLLEGTDEPTARAVAERVRRALRAPVLLPDAVEVVTASVGLALADAPGADLVADADAAMYAAKRAGGDRVVVADPSTRSAGGPSAARRADTRTARRPLPEPSRPA